MGTETDPAGAGLAAQATTTDSPTRDNQTASEWVNGLDDGIKERVKKFKTPAELAKSYVELETFASKSVHDMTPQEQEKFLKRLDLPESPEGYELSDVPLPEELKRTKEADDQFKALLAEVKVTKAQGKRLHEWALKRAAEGYAVSKAAQQRQMEEAASALHTIWGPSYEANNRRVDQLVKLGGEKFMEKMTVLGKDPTVRAGLYEISKLFSDDTLAEGRVEKPAPPKNREGFVFDVSKVPELTGAERRLR
jgi:hypothetical protein